MRSLSEYDADLTARTRQYRERARLLRSNAETGGAAQRADLIEMAKELEELADIVERLRFGD